jgi:hypothetical protein
LQAGEYVSMGANERLRHDPREFSDVVASFGLALAGPSDCEEGRAMAADLISPHVASAITFHRVQERTASAVFVWRESGQITGVLGMIPITASGLEAIVQHRFDQRNPPSEYLCAPGDPFFATYGWGIVGRTRKASAVVMQGAMALRDRYASIPFFTRAVTPSGAKVVRGRMGYSPYPGAPDDLLWNPVRTNQERAA